MPLALSEKEESDLDRRFKTIKKEIEVDTKKKSIDFKNFSSREKLIYYLSEQTDGFVGADIESFVREAAMIALREDINNKKVNLKCFDEALKKMSASVTKSDMDKYRRIEQEYLKSAKSAIEQPVGYLG